MPQELSQQQVQEQKLLQQQRITQQQLANSRLLQMSLAELEQCVRAELDDNPALESTTDDTADADYDATDSSSDAVSATDSDAQDDYNAELTAALQRLDSDDDEADRDSYDRYAADNKGDIVDGATLSFRDKLLEQVGELTLTTTERAIMEYLVDSLDDDGYMRKEIEDLVDELAIYEYIDTDEGQVRHLLQLLHTFDPPGIGARDLQECLRLQVSRLPEGRLKECMLTVVDTLYDAFTQRRWDKIQAALGLNTVQSHTLRQALTALNPRPGAPLASAVGTNKRTITPDIIVYTDHQGHLALDLNNGRIPSVALDETFREMQERYKSAAKGTLSTSDREAMVYVARNVERANMFLAALQQRQKTITTTMQAIVAWQNDYFLSGDEALLRPMRLEDISAQTGLDISTISRVSNEKYVQTAFGILPVKHFFSNKTVTKAGEEVSTRAVKEALKELIDHEDKGHPLSDEALARALIQRGFTTARRTVMKYREAMGIPSSRLRKE